VDAIKEKINELSKTVLIIHSIQTRALVKFTLKSILHYPQGVRVCGNKMQLI